MIPLLIHLLNKHRRSTTDWAAIDFIIEAWNREKSRTWIRNYTLLAIRCTIPLLMGLILSGPQNHGPTTNRVAHRYIIVDDGVVSTTSVDGNTIDIELNKIDAISQIDSTESEYIHIQRTSETQSEPRTYRSKEAAKSYINGINPQNSKSDISGAISSVRKHITQSKTNNPHVHIASQFRKGSLGINKPNRDWPNESTLTITAENTNPTRNISIESADPNRGYRLKENKRNSTEPQLSGVDVVFNINTDTPPPDNVRYSVSSGETVTNHNLVWPKGVDSHRFTIPTAIDSDFTRINITDPDGVEIDNTYYIHTPTIKSIKSIIIDRKELGEGSTRWIETALHPHPETPIQTETIDPTQIIKSEFESTGCVFLVRPDLCSTTAWKTLLQFTEDGGTLVVFPSHTNNDLWPDEFRDVFGFDWIVAGDVIDFESPQQILQTTGSGSPWNLLGGELTYLLDAVRINKHMALVLKNDNQMHLSYSTNQPAVVEGQTKSGSVFVFGFSFDTEWSNIATKPIVVPLLQEIVRTYPRVNKQTDTVHPGVDPNTISYRLETTYIQNGSTRLSIFPESDETKPTPRPIPSSGYWSAHNGGGRTGETITVNIEPGSTDTTICTQNEIDEYLGDMWFRATIKKEISAMRSFDQYLIAVLVIFIILETLISHGFKSNVWKINPAQRGDT